MVAAGTWIRTIAGLHPKQIVGRPSYRLRRAIAPHVATRLQPWAFRIPDLPGVALSPTAFGDEQREALRRGELALVGLAGALPEDAPYIPAHDDPLYVYEFHQLGWFAGALATLPEADPLHGRLIDWLDRYLAWDHPGDSPYWDAYPLASRLLTLLPLAARGFIGGKGIERALGASAVAILGLQETHLQGNHLLRSRAAAAVSSVFFEGPASDSVAASAWTALVREANAQFCADGVHEERTPTYHLLCISDLLVCIELARKAQTPAIRAEVEALVRIAARALGALDVLTHVDGRIAAFGDSAPASSLRSDDLRAFAAAVGIRSTGLLDVSKSGGWARQTAGTSGYTLLQSSGLSLFLSHGPFGAKHQPGHAHCDLFAFELDVEGTRMIVDPGVHAYHDTEWRLRSRASSVHATPSVEGREQAEIWSRFRCGWRPTVEPARWEAKPNGWRVDLRAAAFGPKPMPVERTIEFAGTQIRFVDRLPVEFSVALPLAPDVEVRVDSRGASLVHPKAAKGIQVTLESGTLDLETCSISHAFGARTPSCRLRLRSDAAGRLGWSLQA
ncbi:heparinase II/III family protein [Vulgatibacter incomptus]|uniref:Uncharacterized protein n=1 Tax=Vulgatibacter incomptus TaxID=1391653 RepID=A0A0K1PJ17_9BACT|nr:heparinase II/III family protein [Vulgatibacter incomptus]AKU93099.1 hypothetical protein AKJ08_3486 [Vulgatibacter incomptus]